jgi:hypothetical protein
MLSFGGLDASVGEAVIEGVENRPEVLVHAVGQRHQRCRSAG